jgi:hypothetical protein
MRNHWQCQPENHMHPEQSESALGKTRKKRRQPAEFRVVALRECPLPESMQFCTEPQHAAAYWQAHVVSNPYFNPECECFVILLLADWPFAPNQPDQSPGQKQLREWLERPERLAARWLHG